MKPTEDLIHEHKAIKVMLGIMKNIADDISDNKGVDAEDIERIVDFLRTFADKCHHGKEEDALFPALVAAGLPQKSGPIAVMLYDHLLGRNYINTIETAVKNYTAGQSDQPIADGLLNYVDLLRGHILKEESILFPMADRILSEETQEQIAGRFEIIEEEVIGHGIHEKYHDLLEELRMKYSNVK
jgi:hemerythrin-like domain-containing protein